MKPGTRIEVRNFRLDGQPHWERARIGRWHAEYRANPALKPAGYHPVTFDADGARLLVHEESFRVVDNGAPR
jgi:hypothetical protein